MHIKTQQRGSNRNFPAGNPIANALVVVAGLLVVGFSIVLGVVAFVALASVLLVLAAVIGIRVWWLKRKLQKHFAKSGDNHTTAGTNDGRIDVIEGEYQEITHREEQRRR